MMHTVRMSFLGGGITLTRYRLSQTTRVPPTNTWGALVLKTMVHEHREVRVELHDAAGRTCKYVDTMPAWLLYLFDPLVTHRIYFDPNTQQWVNPIIIPSTEHSAEIEIPALRWVLRQMHGVANCLPVHNSIGQAILLYRALQLLHFSRAASDFRTDLLQEIYNKALTAYDVQRIWWAFYRTNEWPEWLDKMFANLAHYGVYKSREGNEICYFIETEMHQLTEAERRDIQRVYQHYQEPEPAPVLGAVNKAKEAMGKGWGRLTCAPATLVNRRERDLID